MKLPFSFLSLLLFAQITFAQSFILRGTVYTEQDTSRVPFATVLNQTKGDGVYSDGRGEFALWVSPDDTIRISTIGLETFSFVASKGQNDVSIYLLDAIQQIDTIVVHAFPTKEQFKREFMNLQLPDENQINLNIPENMVLSMPQDIRDTRVRAANELPSVGAIITIPRGPTKLQKQENALDRAKKVEHDIDRKYGDAFISKLTGIEDPEKIAALRKFCNLPKDFILNHSEYDVAVAIVDCYKEFEKKN